MELQTTFWDDDDDDDEEEDTIFILGSLIQEAEAELHSP